jgi:hypothetical protein
MFRIFVPPKNELDISTQEKTEKTLAYEIEITVSLNDENTCKVNDDEKDEIENKEIDVNKIELEEIKESIIENIIDNIIENNDKSKEPEVSFNENSEEELVELPENIQKKNLINVIINFINIFFRCIVVDVKENPRDL